MVEKIGIIGYGNMGSAIAERIKSKYKVFVFDKDKNKTGNLEGINVVNNLTGLIKQVDTVILAVKPQDFDAVLNEIKSVFDKDKLIISIAAGIPTKFIEKILGKIRVVRIMPNIGAKIGESMSCLCKGRFASRKDLDLSAKLFNKLGKTLIISEKMMDAATAISGSGPGFYFDIIESKKGDYIRNSNAVKSDFIISLTKAAESIGFNRKDAELLSVSTASVSEHLTERTNLTPSKLKKQVASKGGTTEAGLKVLQRGGSLIGAVKAALKRAKELSKS
jgi:pyrroline-5-carboxylate reductase